MPRHRDAGLLWAGHSILGWDGAVIDALALAVIVGASGGAIGYLLRERAR